MRVVGFSLVANAVRLDFPVLEALRSILPLVDELIVNVGPSSDGTRELIEGLADPRLRIIDGVWESAAGSAMLAVETQRALDVCQGDWAIYIQADEVLHEDGLGPLRQAMAAACDDRSVDALLVDFVHFYGGEEWVAGGRSWYRREVRVVRPGIGLRSHQDAQGFRRSDGAGKPRARRSGATYHHYGWARPLAALAEKREIDNALYHPGGPGRRPLGAALPWEVGVRRFTGTHPAVIRDWLARRRPVVAPQFLPGPWSVGRLTQHASLGLERLTGWRPFEYTNYIEV
jgi:glycosyltransferase involved in cell wall biosynthesis